MLAKQRNEHLRSEFRSDVSVSLALTDFCE